MTRRRHTIVMADDHPLILEGLASLVGAQSDFKIVALCSDGDSALQATRASRPALVLVDLRMPKANGLFVARAVRKELPLTRLILLSASLDDKEISEAVAAGISGIILKEAAPDLLLRCLRHVAAGNEWLPPVLVGSALAREGGRVKKSRDLAELLTPRERQVMRLIAAKLSNKEIAKGLSLSEGTVKLHVHHIYRKLSVKRRSELADLGALLSDQ